MRQGYVVRCRHAERPSVMLAAALESRRKTSRKVVSNWFESDEVTRSTRRENSKIGLRIDLLRRPHSVALQHRKDLLWKAVEIERLADKTIESGLAHFGLILRQHIRGDCDHTDVLQPGVLANIF